VEGRTAIVKRPFTFTAHRRLVLILLLVVGGGIIILALLHHGAPGRDRPPPASTPPAGRGTATGAPAPAASAGRGTPAPGAPSAPVRIRIEAIGASAPIDPLGLNADGTLQVPTDFNRAGYYTGRPMPGAIGPAIIVAHVDSKAGPAVFYRLRDLKPGEEVAVTRADQSEVVFVVDRLEQHPKNAFPTNDVYGATPDATLRLITCGGSFDRSARHYRDNLIAFAHMKP
jgi:Sortase domain